MENLQILDHILRWVLLVLVFYFLSYLFGDRIELEGAMGYLLPLVILAPLNMFSEYYLESLKMGADLAATHDDGLASKAPILAILVVLNFSLLFALNKLLPGITISSTAWLALFALAFSVAAYALQFVPPLPEVPIGFAATQSG